MSDKAPRPSTAAVCERHGLRYDPTQHEGCVLCRRERGAAATESTSAGSSGSSPGRAWAVAALIWLLAGGTLYVAHREVLASFAPFLLAAEGALGADEPVIDPLAEPAPDVLPETDEDLFSEAQRFAAEAEGAELDDERFADEGDPVLDEFDGENDYD